MAITPKSKQRGISLISMLIGLFISMLCILASLTLYKNLIHVAAESKLDALFDGQLASALMVAQMQIQNAGYGIQDAGANEIKIDEVAASGGTDAKSNVYWRYFDNATYVCEGLREETITETIDGESKIYRELSLVSATAANGCNAANNLSTMTWAKSTILARWQKVGVLDSYVSNNARLLRMSIGEKQCSPFGAVTQEKHLQLTIEAPSSTNLNTDATNVATAFNRLNLCLPNTYPG